MSPLERIGGVADTLGSAAVGRGGTPVAFCPATGQQEHKRDACKSAKMFFHVQIRVHEHRGAKMRVRPLGGRGQSVAVELANEAASVGVHL